MKIRKVSVICPVFNEERFIEPCLMSILEQDYPKEYIEVFIIDGNSTDKTRDIVSRYTREHSFIKLLDNPRRYVPYALNLGLKVASGEVIMRLDGHCTYPTNYISELVKYLYLLNADNVGGVWNTQPAKNTVICQAIAQASSHPFGVGGSMHKIGSSKIIETDTVPFGCYKREVFEKTGLFDTDLVRNQDDEFNGRLLKLGGKIFLIPQVIINYTARDGGTCHHQAVFPYCLPFMAGLRRYWQLHLAIHHVCLPGGFNALYFHRRRRRQYECHPNASVTLNTGHAIHFLKYTHQLWYRLHDRNLQPVHQRKVFSKIK